MAALLMPYAPMKGEAETPATEAMLTIAPPLSLCHAFQVCWAKPSAEITLVSKTLRATLRSSSAIGPKTGFVPALLIRKSTRPNASMVRSTAAAWCASSCALPATPITRSAPSRLDGLLEGVLFAAGDAHPVAAGDERLGDAVTDAAARTRDQGDLAAVLVTVMHVPCPPASVERSAGDVHDLAGDEAGVLAREEGDGVGDVLGRADALHGDLGGGGGLELLEAHADAGGRLRRSSR